MGIFGNFKPKAGVYDNSIDLGYLPTEFECFEPDSDYTFDPKLRKRTAGEWPLIVPVTPPPYQPLDRILQMMIDSTWTQAEPSAGSKRGDITVGLRGGNAPASIKSDTYHPQVRPTKSNLNVKMPNNSAIATDWKLTKQIPRTHAVTFRGDRRDPYDLIQNYGGFTPPNTRTDDFYLDNAVFNEFADYLKRRYDRDLSLVDFKAAVNKTLTTPDAKSTLVDYLMWRKIMEREAVHLGRMTDNECLKGYISTSRNIDSSIGFATNHGKSDGWLYVVMVQKGFIVPSSITTPKAMWATQEQEIAQWGPIPGERILGFRRVLKNRTLTGNIFLRRTFRKQEPKAFKYMYRVLSGHVPG